MGIDLDYIASHWHGVVIALFVTVWSIAIHEFAHAITAYKLGDDMPRRQGRLTILPTEHFDPLGFMMIVWMSLGGLGLGWGKPVSVNPGAFRHPRRDMLLVAAAGPFSNLVLATIAGLLIRFGGAATISGLTFQFLQSFLIINLALMFFNLIPVAPLDGSKILSNMLPFEQSVRFDKFNAQFGFIILIGLIFFGRTLMANVLGPPINQVAGFLTGLT